MVKNGKEAMRLDGYVNMLNKVGTWKDSSEAYVYQFETPTSDVELAQIYSGNGLFANVINKPAELAFKNGYNLGIGDSDLKNRINKKLRLLRWKEQGSTALKWARLFGGGAILMGIDDGGDWDEPVNMDQVQGITHLVTFERPEIMPDYRSILHRTIDIENMDCFGRPEYYLINPIYGGSQIRVHESRLLIFRNGELPRTSSMSTDYMFFGAPEYNRIKRELKDTVTTHGNGYRLLERCIQAVYKMKNLASLMATEQGEDDVIRRMQLIDMARSLLNTMVIDGEGEEFAFQSYQLSGVKDIIDESCNLLSAVTNIPQTVLFGRSPAGENATGDGDLTNYYDYVGQIQELSVTGNLQRLVRLILRAELNTGKIQEVPEYEIEPNPLWNMSEKEKAELEQAKAAAELTRAQATQVYVDMQVLDPLEVRKTLAETDLYRIEDVLSEDDLELERLLGAVQPDIVAAETEPPTAELGQMQQRNTDAVSDMPETRAAVVNPYDLFAREEYSDIPHSGRGAAVIIIHDGRILCGKRSDDGLICGPGGHIEYGEVPEYAAVREAMEEFGIIPYNLHTLGTVKGSYGLYKPASAYFTTDFIGTPRPDGKEMTEMMWLSIEELMREKLFPPFEESLGLLLRQLIGTWPDEENGTRGG